MWSQFKRWLGLRGSPRTAALRIVFYTRAGCHLCEDALAMLGTLRGEFPHEVEIVDIDSQPELVARYGDKVPVLVVKGREKMWGKINFVLLRRLLEGESRG